MAQMKARRPRDSTIRITAICSSKSIRVEVWTSSRLDTLANDFSPPNSTPAAAAISSRLEEAKKLAELSAWPSSWPSMKRLSRRAIWRIHSPRITRRSLFSTPPPDRALSSGS